MRLKIFLIVSALCSLFLAACQPAGGRVISLPAPVQQKLARPTRTALTATTPAPQPGKWLSFTDGNDILSLVVAKDGTIWSAGRGGVVAWAPDRQSYRKYTAADGLPVNYITHLVLGPDGRLWASGYDGSVAVLDHDTWKPLNSKAGETLDSLAVDLQGTLWAGTNQGVYTFSGDQWQLVASTASHSMVTSMLAGSDGTIWTGQKGRVSFLKNDVWQTHPLADKPLVSSLAEAPDHTIWIGAEGSLIHFDGQNWETYVLQGGGDVRAVSVDAHNTVWFTRGDTGVFSFNPASQKLESFPLPGASALALGPDGSPWSGGYYTGLQHLAAGAFQTFTTADAGMGNFVVSGVVGPDGAVWFGTQQGTLTYDGQNWRSAAQKAPVLAIAVTADGKPWYGYAADRISAMTSAGQNVWKASKDDLTVFDGQSQNSVLPTDGYADKIIFRALTTAPDGSVWVGTRHGVARFNGQTWLALTLPLSDIVTSVAVSAQGNLWVGTLRSGVYAVDSAIWNVVPKDSTQSIDLRLNGLTYATINPSGSPQSSDASGEFLKLYTKQDGLPSNHITAVQIGADGIAWVATSDGLVRLSANGWELVSGLGDHTVQTLLVDHQGHIWAGMPLGGIAECIP